MVAGVNAQIIKSGNITASETWTSNNIYILNGWVYVKAGATLTIQPGTIIKGDFATQGALIIERDAKIIANGTVDQPIVFTSQKSVGQRNYGDWGGLIICGRGSCNAPANVSLGTQQGEAVIEGGVGSFYGGGTSPNDQDSSGVLRHLRIEFPGIAFQPNSEINGLTCGAVGSKTVIEHVQVSYSGDDSFEFFGGAVNCKWLIAYRGWDDDFDTDFGYHGKIQFAVSVRDPNIADASGSNGFESDNDATGTGSTPITQPIFSNVSIFGAYCFNSTINNNYKRALHLRRNTRTSTFNSVFAGYPTGLLIESSSTQGNATNGDLRFKNCAIVQMNDSLAATTASNPNNVNGSFNIGNPSTSTGWFYTNGFGNQTINSVSSLMINNLNNTMPELTLMAGSPILTGASFSDTYLNDPFFTPVSYIGAFGTTDWTDCWAEWDPQNQAYNAAINNVFSASATAQGSTTFCQGGSVVLDATTAGAATYAWSNGGTTAQITVTTSGTYSCTVTKSNGCSAVTNAVAVTVNPTPTAPTISANGPTTFCNGDTVILTSSQTSGIVWSNSSTAASITVVSSGSYDVTYTDGNGCSVTSAATSVTVNANPSAPVVTANGSTSFCTGDSVMLSSSQSGGNVWSTGATTQDIYVSQSGTYSVTYTDANGCSATSSATNVSVSSSPAPTVSITGSTQLCPGESVTLTSSAGDTYQWYLNGNPINGATSQTYSASAAGTYAVDVTNSDPCNGAGMSANTTVTTLTAPTAGFTWGVPVVNQYQFTSTSANATIYAWDFGDLSSSSAQNPVHIYTANGTYTVTLIVTGSNGCTDTTTQVINFVSGVEEVATLSAMTVYPNPANDVVNITFNMNSGSDVNVFAYDMTGKVLVNENQDLVAGTTNVQYNTSEWANGTYFFRVTENGVSNTVRVVIAR
jgi:PKD repeat protein